MKKEEIGVFKVDDRDLFIYLVIFFQINQRCLIDVKGFHGPIMNNHRGTYSHAHSRKWGTRSFIFQGGSKKAKFSSGY